MPVTKTRTITAQADNRKENAMNKILEYLATLTPEQLQKLVDNLPKLKDAIK